MTGDIWRWDAVEVAAAIRTKKISAREATMAALRRMETANPRINAVTVPLADQALAAADMADRMQAKGEALGLLHGIPVTIKENVDQEGCSTPNGVVAYEKIVAETDSPPVANWRKAGAIIIGRTNTPGFSYRWDTDNTLRGRTYNPWSREHTAGGSSGGAGSSVASGIGHLAHGNDYGGSIRYPAYCCGVAGIRPSLGRVPAFNATAPAERPLTGQVMSVQGPLGRRVRDVRLGLAAMAGRDARDPWWAPAPLDGPPPQRPIRVAIFSDWGSRKVHADVAGALRQASNALAAAGYAVEPATPPGVDRIAELWRLLVVNEMRQLTKSIIQRDGDPGIQKAFGYFDALVPEIGLADYMKGVAERNKWLREWSIFQERHTLVLAPVSLEPPFKIGFDTTSVERMADVMAAQTPQYMINFLGLPATAVPVGTAAGLPMGVQVIAPRFREDLSLDAAEVIEAQHGLPTPVDPR
ncbi:MAG: amidase [Alphaproteobacteria bacterium]|nr:amidase [Alphaproteobacteria bacterium]